MTPASIASLPSMPLDGISRDGAASLRVKRFGTVESLSDVAADWDAVQDLCPNRHVLLDHRWVKAWWKAFGHGKDLHGLLVERNGRAIGLAPMVLSKGLEAWPSRDGLVQVADDYEKLSVPAWRRVVPIRRVTFPLNVPSHNARGHALVSEDAGSVCAAILDYWNERRKEWDVLVLEGLPVESGQIEHFSREATARGLLTLPHGRIREMYRADLTGGMEAYLTRRGGHFRKRRKEQLRACQKAGRLDLVQYRGPDILRGLEIMFDIERATWKAKPGSQSAVDMSLDPQLRAFFTDVAVAFAETNQAVIHVMSLDGRPAGAMMGLSRGQTMLSLVIYLRDDMREVLNAAPLWDITIQDAIARGMTELDTHGVSPHARKWATHADIYQRRYIFNPSAKGYLLWASKALATSLSRRIAAGGSESKGERNGRN